MRWTAELKDNKGQPVSSTFQARAMVLDAGLGFANHQLDAADAGEWEVEGNHAVDAEVHAFGAWAARVQTGTVVIAAGGTITTALTRADRRTR